MLPIKPMLDILFLRIKIINDNISIGSMTGCKDNKLKPLAQSLKHVPDPRPNIDSSPDNIAIGKNNRQFNLMFHFNIFIAMDKSFIKVKNYCFFEGVLGRGQI